MNKKVYLSDPEWTKTHDNLGGVKADIVFDNPMEYEEYDKEFNDMENGRYYYLTDKDYKSIVDKLKEIVKNKKSIDVEASMEYLLLDDKDLDEFEYILYGEEEE